MTDANTTKVWDPLVRTLHWGLAASITVAFVTGDEVMAVHLWAGLTAVAVIVTRILWGFVGTRHARFRDFIPTPGEALTHLRGLLHGDGGQHLGHNPAAGAMVIVLWLGGLVVAATGLAGYIGLGGELFEELHEGLAWGLLALIALHLVGVLVSSLVEGRNLAISMLTGRKRGISS
jgi:cytochrome b